MRFGGEEEDLAFVLFWEKRRLSMSQIMSRIAITTLPFFYKVRKKARSTATIELTSTEPTIGSVTTLLTQSFQAFLCNLCLPNDP